MTDQWSHGSGRSPSARLSTISTIDQNVDDYLADRITGEEFNRRQAEAWAAAEQDGTKEETLRALRERRGSESEPPKRTKRTRA